MHSEITNTQKIYITTTGITKTEQTLFTQILPAHIVLQDRLSTTTTFLLSYKCILTPKYIQALRWRIPVLKIRFAYDGSRTKLQNFENCLFSTSQVSNDIFKNFLVIQGATHRDEVGRGTQLLLTTDRDTEKALFCIKHGIPIVEPSFVFEPDFMQKLRLSTHKYFAEQKTENLIFENKTFLIDNNLHLLVFNKLKRMIVENGGTRVSVLSDSIDYVLSDGDMKIKQKVYFYQFVFDCVENKSLILAESYTIHPIKRYDILENVTCAISNDLSDVWRQLSTKLTAMGARVKPKLDMHCNYFVVKNRGCEKKEIKQKIVSFDWIDHCLYALKKVREEKYLAAKKSGDIFKSINTNKVKYLLKKETKRFQFTGLPTHVKNNAVKMCVKYGIDYVDSEEYEKCTHLVMGKVSTSEKFLGALANGAWILQPSFVDDFDNSPNFNYDRYEWRVLPEMTQSDAKIVECVRKWRLRVMENGLPAFSGWVVNLVGEPHKVKSYERVLTAGGAIVSDGEDCNKVFVMKGYESVKNGKSTDYIFAYLFKND